MAHGLAFVLHEGLFLEAAFLEPGVDPVAEADRRGTILAIVRLGAIDLEMPVNGVSVPNVTNVTVPGSAVGTVLPPADLPSTVAPSAINAVNTVPVDTQPAADAPRTAANTPESSPGLPKLSDEIPPAPVPVPAPAELPPPAAPGEIQLSTPN